MKKFLYMTTALAALGIAAPQVSAQDSISHQELYMQRDDAGTYRIFDENNPDGADVLMSENGQQPADCPDGTYFMDMDLQTDQVKQVRGCNTEDEYDVGQMSSDAMMDNGEPFGTVSTDDPGRYEDTFTLTPRVD